ncbi:MAG: response regulator, partial [Ruminiclostridium sp.]|nr:response regulator [Ruminiclostridium sp.]
MSINALVVDDSNVERMYLSTLLEKFGIEVTEAGNCDECIIKAAEQKYDIMFIDYFMPDADGVHALKEIRNHGGSLNRNTPAIALGTADPMLNDNFFINQGFDNYIEKPVNYEMLHASLLLYLRGEKRDE